MVAMNKTNDNCDKCLKCEKEFLENDSSAIGCEGNCRQWYHRDCAGLSSIEFNVLKGRKANVLWMYRLVNVEDY